MCGSVDSKKFENCLIHPQLIFTASSWWMQVNCCTDIVRILVWWRFNIGSRLVKASTNGQQTNPTFLQSHLVLHPSTTANSTLIVLRNSSGLGGNKVSIDSNLFDDSNVFDWLQFVLINFQPESFGLVDYQATIFTKFTYLTLSK